MNIYEVQGKLAIEFLDLLDRFPEGLTFAQIYEELPITGKFQITSSDNPNIVLWGGMNETFCQIFCAFRKMGFIYTKYCDIAEYDILHMSMVYEVAEKNKIASYTTPHWLPTKIISDMSRVKGDTPK